MNDRNDLEQAMDPELEGLLDAALAVGETPSGLTDRIMAATQQQLPSADPVIARVGFSVGWYPIAAAILVAVMAWASVWMADPVTRQGGSQQQVASSGIEGVDWSDHVEDDLDRELTALEAELAMETDSSDWDGQWDGQWDSQWDEFEQWDDSVAVEDGLMWDLDSVY